MIEPPSISDARGRVDLRGVPGICVLGTRRTGSNHLFTLLRSFPELASGGEFFSPLRVSGSHELLPDIRNLTGLYCRTEEDALLSAYARGNPGAFLDVVAAAAARQGKRAYSFKIFEDQLPRDVIASQVLTRPGMHMVLLIRRAIDTYISLEKARHTDEWMTRDTTRTRVPLDARAFAEWLEQQRSWYRHWLAWAAERGQTPTILTYEEDIDRPLRIVLWRFLRTARRLDIRLRMPLLISNRGLKRQDRNRDIAPRVENWDEFSVGLVRLGLEQDAFGYPL